MRAGHPETEPPGHHEDEPGGESVPFRGFRGLQERIAKSTRVVWLPYPPRSSHSSCILVHVFPARYPGITPFPPCPHPVFGNSENTPESASSFHERFRCHSTRSSLLGRSSAHSDSEMSATVTAVFRSSFQTAPGIGQFRGPCRIQAGFHDSVLRPHRDNQATRACRSSGYGRSPTAGLPRYP